MKSIGLGVANIDSVIAEPEVGESLKPLVPQDNEIVFENVGFSYNKNQEKAVKALDFTLRQNTITGLVGSSDSEKSTVAQLILRFYESQTGRITIGGVDIKNIATSMLMEKIGYVFQDSVIFKDTVEANIRMGNTKATRAQVEEAAKAAAIHSQIMNLPKGYNTVIGEGEAYLSGG